MLLKVNLLECWNMDSDVGTYAILFGGFLLILSFINAFTIGGKENYLPQELVILARSIGVIVLVFGFFIHIPLFNCGKSTNKGGNNPTTIKKEKEGEDKLNKELKTNQKKPNEKPQIKTEPLIIDKAELEEKLNQLAKGVDQAGLKKEIRSFFSNHTLILKTSKGINVKPSKDIDVYLTSLDMRVVDNPVSINNIKLDNNGAIIVLKLN